MLEEIVYGFNYQDNVTFKMGCLRIERAASPNGIWLYSVVKDFKIIRENYPLLHEVKMHFFNELLKWQEENRKLGITNRIVIQGMYGNFKDEYQQYLERLKNEHKANEA